MCSSGIIKVQINQTIEASCPQKCPKLQKKNSFQNDSKPVHKVSKYVVLVLQITPTSENIGVKTLQSDNLLITD